VIHLVWPPGERNPNPQGNLIVRWQDRMDSVKPSKSSSPKYIGLVTDEGQQWIGYRVSPKDREVFETLRAKWGMWFLRVSCQGDSKDSYFTFFNDGGFFAGSVVTRLDEYVQSVNAANLREMLVRAWNDSLNLLRKKMPHALPGGDEINRRFAAISKIPSVLEDVGGGPLPWVLKELPHWGKPSKKSHDEVIRMYLTILGALKRNSDNKKISEKFRHECGKMYVLLRRAKIFEIAPEAYIELHMRVDRYVTEEIAQLPFHHPDDPKIDQEILDREGLILIERQIKACENLPFPEKLPFNVCWFAISVGVVLSGHQIESRGLKGPTGTYLLAGIIIGDDGEHHEILLSQGTNKRGGYIDTTSFHVVTHRVEEAETWQHVACLAPFVMHSMIDCINDHQTTIVDQRKLSIHSQGRIKKGLEDLGIKRPVPPPFYTVNLRDNVIKEVVKGWMGGQFRAKHSHRFDVRGHWCFKIYRGQMPMDSEMELDLEKLNYNIFKTKPLDELTVEALRERGQPPRQANEWIAIKRFWKNSYVKGPDDSPYIPSTRKATKGVLAIDNKSNFEESGPPDEVTGSGMI
jgi:hypothetical protein